MEGFLIFLLLFVVAWGVCSTIMMGSKHYPHNPDLQKRIYGRVLDESEAKDAWKIFDVLKRTPLSIIMVISMIRAKQKTNIA